jgi:hypothetical protein
MVGTKSQQYLTGRNSKQRDKILCLEGPDYNRNDRIGKGIYYDNQYKKVGDDQDDSLRRKTNFGLRLRIPLQSTNSGISGSIR